MVLLLEIGKIEFFYIQLHDFKEMGNCCTFAEKTTQSNIFTSDISNIPRHTYSGQFKYCRLSNIYDGDTADIYFYDGLNIIRSPFRFYGFDSAEMKPRVLISNREEVKHQAIADKNYLTSLVENKKLVVRFMENEKYGRMMGEVWRITNEKIPSELLSTHPELIDSNNIAKLMIVSGHGKPYYGGKKE